ncbi:MAG: outer membrane lipoprotein chaperone LolA [Deltaproteobacteria bacterium]|nr:outer membrane lipoprotein chaperone LolA [Deltaproteobacteria bacterium]
MRISSAALAALRLRLPKAAVAAASALVLFVARAPMTFAGTPKVDEIVRKVQQRYDATKDFTADVSQEATITSLNKTVTASGTVAFKKPGKMRWELTQGDPQTVVADGTTMWVYRPQDNQVVKLPFQQAFHSNTPLSFLSGVGRIADDFSVTFDGESDGLYHLLLVPRQQSSDVGKLRLSVGTDSYDIRGAEVTDPLGNVSRLKFDKIQRNLDLNDQRFVFEVPPGVDVVTAPAAP